MERKQWFLNRIGKVVYRSEVTCGCEHCKDVYNNGLTVGDKDHADYLYDWECITSIDYPKLPVRYFDTIKQRDEYESKIKQLQMPEM
jgi:predicted metal-binding protein